MSGAPAGGRACRLRCPARWLGRCLRQDRLPDRVGQRLQVIGHLLGRHGRQPDHIPATGTVSRSGAWRTGRSSAAPQRRPAGRAGGGVAVHVRQRVTAGPACRWAVSSGGQSPAHLAHGTVPAWARGLERAREPHGRRTRVESLTTADGIDPQAVTPPPGALCAIVSPRAAPGASRAARSGIRSVIVQTGDSHGPGSARIRRRDRHGRGLRGMLAPPDAPMYRTRAERFDDLVLQAVAQLEPRWSAELSSVEFAVEEIPAAGVLADLPDPVPLARLDSGSGNPRDSRAAAAPPRIVLFRRRCSRAPTARRSWPNWCWTSWSRNSPACSAWIPGRSIPATPRKTEARVRPGAWPARTPRQRCHVRGLRQGRCVRAARSRASRAPGAAAPRSANSARGRSIRPCRRVSAPGRRRPAPTLPAG